VPGRAWTRRGPGRAQARLPARPVCGRTSREGTRGVSTAGRASPRGGSRDDAGGRRAPWWPGQQAAAHTSAARAAFARGATARGDRPVSGLAGLDRPPSHPAEGSGAPRLAGSWTIRTGLPLRGQPRPSGTCPSPRSRFTHRTIGRPADTCAAILPWPAAVGRRHAGGKNATRLQKGRACATRRRHQLLYCAATYAPTGYHRIPGPPA
jgi:hypothetical protein